GMAAAEERAARLLEDPKAPAAERLGLIEVLGQVGRPQSVPTLLRLLRSTEPKAVRLAALSALQPFEDSRGAETVLGLYPQMPSDLRSRAQTLLCGRLEWSRQFLQAVDGGKIDPKEVPFDQQRRLLMHKDEQVHRLVEKHWGKITAETPGEKRARMASIKHIL